MKKAIFFVVAALIFAQGVYILKLRDELNVRKNINKDQIIKILHDTNVSYAYTKKIEDMENGLSEPSNMGDGTDILDRIDMLEQHAIYNPSSKWIKDVQEHAKREISYLRNHQMIKVNEVSYADCTRYLRK